MGENEECHVPTQSCCGRFFFGRMNFILPNEFMEIFCVLFGIWYYFCII